MDSQLVLGQHGAPFQIEFQGKKYTLYFRTGKITSAIEKHVKELKLAEIRAKKKDFEDLGIIDEVRDELRQFYKDCNSIDPAKNYAFDGEKVQQFLVTPEGILELLRQQLPEAAALSQEEFQNLVVEKQEEITEYFELCQETILTIQKELGWDVEADPMGKKQSPKVLKRFRKMVMERIPGWE
jgi:hypothetical protein